MSLSPPSQHVFLLPIVTIIIISALRTSFLLPFPTLSHHRSRHLSLLSPLYIHLLHAYSLSRKFRLQRRPSSLKDSGYGLYLISGQVKKGDVLTCYPGLIYQIPYDLEKCMFLDELTLTLHPPDFVIKNDYLLRLYHEPTHQHLLLDGCPRGASALNYIKANQVGICR